MLIWNKELGVSRNLCGSLLLGLRNKFCANLFAVYPSQLTAAVRQAGRREQQEEWLE
jgi:hypothetical protein